MKLFKVIVVIVLLINVINLKASEKTDPVFTTEFQSTQIVGDSLVISKITNNKEVVIREGKLIKLWINNEGPIKGNFSFYRNDSLGLLHNNKLYVFNRKDFYKMKIYGPVGARVGGGIVQGIGAITLFYASVSLVAGGVSLAKGELGAIVLFAVPPFAIAGGGLYAGGNRIRGRKVNFDRKWEILDK